MMALRIALLMMAINGSLGWVVSTGILDYSTAVNNVDPNTIRANTPDLNYSSQTVTTYIFGDFLRILPTLKVIIENAIIPYSMLTSFYVPVAFAALITLICWVFYAMAVIQILGNRSERLYR